MKIFSLVFIFLPFVSPAKVLFLPSSFYASHGIPMKTLAEELADHGHDVKWIEYATTELPLTLSKGIIREFWETPLGDRSLEDLFVYKNSSVYTDMWDKTDGFSVPISAWMASIRLCDNVLRRHRTRFEQLITEKFDTVVVNDQFNPCGLLLAARRGDVFIYWSMSAMRPESAWAHNSPSPPSYLPVPGTKYTDDMGIIERSNNMLEYLKAIFIHQQVVQPRIDAVFQKHYPGTPSVFAIERNASLNFVNTPPIFDFPRAFMPRVTFVGCIHCKNHTLSKKFDDFIGNSKFIVVSGGIENIWERAPKKMKTAFTTAFASRPHIKFVVQSSAESTLANVFTSSFLPLQALLGHPDCVAHITHGGLLSVVESVYHGVPVIGIPILFPAHDNLLRLTARGAGLIIEKSELTSYSLVTAIDLIRDNRVKEATLEFQDMVRDVPYTELAHAMFWIGFIERHHEIPQARSGADHLNILQYMLVDVAAFFIFLSIFLSLLIYYIFSFICTFVRYLISPLRASRAGKKKKE